MTSLIQPLISIIVPTLNEEQNIALLLDKLQFLTGVELIICDGGSSDKTVDICRAYPIKVTKSPVGRGAQLDAGAECAQGDILLFLHADSMIEARVLDDIRSAVSQGYQWGCCTLRFNDDKLIFRVIALMSNLRSRVFSSCYGDQAIYCQRDFFWNNEGFPPTIFLEDIGLSRKLRGHQRARIIKGKVVTSTRRFRETGIGKTIVKMQMVKLLYSIGIEPEALSRWYKGGPRKCIQQ